MIKIKEDDIIELSLVVVPKETSYGIIDDSTLKVVVNGNKEYQLIEKLEDGITGLFMDMETGEMDKMTIILL